MASPSASSATLPIDSEDYHPDGNGEGNNFCSVADDKTVAIPDSPCHQTTLEFDEVVYVEDEDSFVLSDTYYMPAPKSVLTATMRAASHPDPRVLKTVLSHANHIYWSYMNKDLLQRENNGIPLPSLASLGAGEPRHFAGVSQEFGLNSLRVSGHKNVGITSPLLESVSFGNLNNVKTLLDAGADPNGVPLRVVENYAAFFLRFRPQIPHYPDIIGDLATRSDFLTLMDLPQISKLTCEEVEDRYWDGMAPFWCEEGFTPKNFYRNGQSIPSLVAGANCGNTEIFNLLLEAGADATFWLTSEDDLPDELTPSCLSMSSPLHAAIEIGSLTMVQHLLELGFNPNVLPLAAPTTCHTPLMATLFNPNFSKAIFDALLYRPDIKLQIRTPVYQVHLLHFAVARFDLDVLRYVSSKSKIPLSSAGTTALGHTLLHIACMPLDAMHIQRRAEIVYRSIHETRDMSAFNDPHARYPTEFDEPIQRYETHFKVQTAIIIFLWDNGICDIEAKDVHGNTALHYLAGCQSMNWGVIEWLRGRQGGKVKGVVERIWGESRNAVAATPEELAEAAMKVRSEGKSGWCPWFERHNSRARFERKEEIWRGLLAGAIVYGREEE